MDKPISSSQQIAEEHCYSKIGPLRHTRSEKFPKTVLFPELICSREGEAYAQESQEDGCDERKVEVDVVGEPLSLSLSYDKPKAVNIMQECTRHVNLIKSPLVNTDLLLDRYLHTCNTHTLMHLILSQTPHEPISRRMNTDLAAHRFRRVLAEASWDSRLTCWAHETLLRVLDSDLLPVYLDVLQVLKAKCPVLVEQMIHSSMSGEGGEALGLLLKRPWNPVAGMASMDRMIAEREPVSLIVSLGLPCRGTDHTWEVSSDPFRTCKVPTFFAVGSGSLTCSVEYVEKLCSEMSVLTKLVIVGGGDDLLRLSSESKRSVTATQSIVDRCIQERLYEFLYHVLPSHPPDESRPLRKRSRSMHHLEDIGSTFLTPSLPHCPIVLSPTVEEQEGGKNLNYNNSNPFLLKSFLSGACPSGSRPSSASNSGSPSPVFFDKRQDSRRSPQAQAMSFVGLAGGGGGGAAPKMGRPRSKSSTVDRSRRKPSLRNRSNSSEQSNTPSSSFVPIFLHPANSNANNSNAVAQGSATSSDGSPPYCLAIPQAHFQPLPITPPRNPYEDPTHERLDPKTVKQLQQRK